MSLCQGSRCCPWLAASGHHVGSQVELSIMARIIRPSITEPSQYRGLEWIFEYTNQDGALSTWNCGQAAAATFLTHHGAMDPVQAAHNMAWLEKHHPPDQFAGWFGTGRRRVERIMRSFELD